MYFTGIVVRIVWLFNNHYELLEPQEYGCVIASILMSILILYWFLLTPIFDFFHWKKLSELGYITWKFLQDKSNIIVECFKQIVKYICELLVSFFPMCGYIILVKKILVLAQIDLTFWLALLILMLYQYMLLKLFSNIIKGIIMLITKKIHTAPHADVKNIKYPPELFNISVIGKFFPVNNKECSENTINVATIRSISI